MSAGDVITVLPFGNEIDMVKIKGSNLRKQLELSVQDYDVIDQHGKFLQFSGENMVHFQTGIGNFRTMSHISVDSFRVLRGLYGV